MISRNCTNQRKHNQNREDFCCFLNEPNAAALIAPNLIQHCPYWQCQPSIRCKLDEPVASVCLSHHEAGLLLCARWARDIDRLLHGRRSAAAAAAPQHGAQQQQQRRSTALSSNASSAALSADVGSTKHRQVSGGSSNFLESYNTM